MIQVSRFKTWKAVTLGRNKSGDDYRRAFAKAGMNIGSLADNILSKPAFVASETVRQVDLVIAFVADLGLKRGADYSEICIHADELGLDLCPAEVGPALCLAHKQAREEWFVIAMEAIPDSSGRPVVFLVEHDGAKLLLSGAFGPPDRFWGSGNRFIFARRT